MGVHSQIRNHVQKMQNRGARMDKYVLLGQLGMNRLSILEG